MTRRPPATPEMIQSYRQGATLNALAAEHDTSPQSIRRRLTDAGEPILPNGRAATAARLMEQSGYDEAQLREWSGEGLTCAEIAERLGRDEESVRRAMVRRGVPRQEGRARPEHNTFWRGGYHVDKHGYILIRMPAHPEANQAGYVRQHRAQMERTLGRPLTTVEVVDHRNGDTSDNRPENLRLYPTNAEHLRDTVTGTKNLPPVERERLRLAAVQRARERVSAILAGSVVDVGPSPSREPRHRS